MLGRSCQLISALLLLHSPLLWAVSASVGILGDGYTPGVDYQLRGIVPNSLTLSRETLYFLQEDDGYAQVNTDTSLPTPAGNVLNNNLDASLRYCLEHEVSVSMPVYLRLDLNGAVWAQPPNQVLVEEGEAAQPVLNKVIDAGNGTVGDEVVNVGFLEAGVNGDDFVVLKIEPATFLFSGTCLTLKYVASGTLAGSAGLLDSTGNLSLRLQPSIDKVSVSARVYSFTDAIGAINAPDATPVLEAANNDWLEVKNQFLFERTQLANVQVNLNDPAFPGQSLVEIGLADDILISNNTADKTAAAMSFKLYSDSSVDDPLPLAELDFLRLQIQGSSTGLGLLGGFVDSDGNAQTAGTALSLTTLNSNRWQVELPGNMMSNNTDLFQDDLVLQLAQNGIPVNQQSAHLSASIQLSNALHPPLLRNLHSDSAAAPSFQFTPSTPGPHYFSLPPPDKIISMSASLGHSVTTGLDIINLGNSDLNLVTASFSGIDASAFTLLPPASDFPLTLPAGGLPLSLSIRCTPGHTGLSSTSLRINSSNTAQTEFSYPLACQGIGQAPQDILLSNHNIQADATAGSLIGILSSIDPDLGETHQYHMETNPDDLFEIQGTRLQLAAGKQVDPNTQTYSLHIRSADSGGLSFSKSFILNVLPAARADFSAKLRTQQGLVDTLNMPEMIELHGIIEARAQDVGKNAQIILLIRYFPLPGQSFDFPFTLAENQTLLTTQEYLLYQGRLLYLAGDFEVYLTYTLDDGSVQSGLAKTFSVTPNQAPQAVFLDGNQIAENSPAETLIGLLSTQDNDREDFFQYALLQNPGFPLPYFAIQDDELRLANSFPLDFEDTPELEIQVRSIDSTGAFIDQNFIIKVQDQLEHRISGELRSQGQVLHGENGGLPVIYGIQAFSAHLRILPDTQHLEKMARIHWSLTLTPDNGDMPSTYATDFNDMLLQEQMEFLLFEQVPLLNTGQVEIHAGYSLLEATSDGQWQLAASAPHPQFTSKILAFEIQPGPVLDEVLPQSPPVSCNLPYQSPHSIDLLTPVNLPPSVDLFNAINQLPLLQDNHLSISQHPEQHYFYLDFDEQRFAWFVRQAEYLDAPEQMGVLLAPDGSLQLDTTAHITLYAQPAIQDICILQNALIAAGYQAGITVLDNGNLEIFHTNGQRLALRPQAYSELYEEITTNYFELDTGQSWGHLFYQSPEGWRSQSFMVVP
ncbi:hypothetical protein QUF61_06380 [Candidatus Venteria ishoeyi]|uniref:hypothetical protein n=1 Tax=Candidatus Venteria ishoeyi TaxID=1899563 RepID=UPI0025A59E7B|nr:hypothetical protein [Candidatus Venteria ishoeyi]MDM8546103.1 hypothetical protein [Candidatus Venteria ishoeyi]